MKSRKKILVADLLCGAGGSSTGCARALAELGLEMDLVCVNHWGVAIDTHKRNHPEARHYVEDIGTVRPHILVPEGYLDLLMASPTCTHHSVARGGKPTSDQQRSDPWHIITWLTELRVKRLIIENVWEFKDWGPVDRRTGRPVQSRKGEYFHAWINTIKALGFDPEWRRLNAADYGDATTRQRFILMARSDRKRVSWPMPTHARKQAGGNLSLFGDMKPWRAASEIVDWSIKGRSIYDRKKPLAAATLARIHAGAMKFGWPEPFIVVLRNHMSAQGIDVPLPALTAGGTHVGLAQPFVIAPGSTGAPRGVSEPLPTITTGGAGSADPGCARPMLINLKGQSTATDIDLPMPTQTAHAGHLYMAEPFVLSQASCGAPRGVAEPMPTQTTGGNGGSHALIAPYYGSGSGETCQSAAEPLPTVTSKGRFSMVVPITHADGSNRARDVDDPLPTLTTANRGEQALVEGTPQFDILFRMLEPHELAAAMGFNDADRDYEFAGTKTQKIKQIGNAVSVAKMKACVRSIMLDAAASDRDFIVQRAAE